MASSDQRIGGYDQLMAGGNREHGRVVPRPDDDTGARGHGAKDLDHGVDQVKFVHGVPTGS